MGKRRRQRQAGRNARKEREVGAKAKEKKKEETHTQTQTRPWSPRHSSSLLRSQSAAHQNAATDVQQLLPTHLCHFSTLAERAQPRRQDVLLCVLFCLSAAAQRPPTLPSRPRKHTTAPPPSRRPTPQRTLHSSTLLCDFLSNLFLAPSPTVRPSPPVAAAPFLSLHAEKLGAHTGARQPHTQHEAARAPETSINDETRGWLTQGCHDHVPLPTRSSTSRRRSRSDAPAAERSTRPDARRRHAQAWRCPTREE